MRRTLAVACLILLLEASSLGDSRNQVFSDFTTPLPLGPQQTLVLGIVGGWERWDNLDRITTRIALMIRNADRPGLFVETVENHKIDLADELIRRAFPDPSNASMVVFGQSLGGPAAIRLCERLKERGIVVRLLVVIDAVGEGRLTIPSNVLAVANLYQRNSYWPIVGAKQLRAEDPSRTRIPCNAQYRYSYRLWSGKKIEKPPYETSLRWDWMGGHLRMEYDPEVWDLVRDMILAELRSSGAGPPWHGRPVDWASTATPILELNIDSGLNPEGATRSESATTQKVAPRYRVRSVPGPQC
jgi:pimeloyl-ACP methyl ester carboxylesterase